MTMFAKILTGTAGLAMAAGAAAPAAAQYSPYGNTNAGIGGVISQILGGGRYGAYGQGNDRVAVDQCARAAEARVSHTNRVNASRNYGQGYGAPRSYDPRYGNQAYGYNTASMARVVGITQVQRQRSGVRVSGVINSGLNHQGAYGYGNQPYANQGYSPYGNQGYAHQAQMADLRFSCRVDYRGQVASLDIKRNVVQRRGY